MSDIRAYENGGTVKSINTWRVCVPILHSEYIHHVSQTDFLEEEKREGKRTV